MCGEPLLGPQHTLTNPVVLVEVLSPSTEASDGGFKFERYQHIDTLKEYVLISQEKPRVESYLRPADGWWKYRSTERLASTVTFESVGVVVPLTEIYDGLMFREWFATDPGA